MPLLDQEAPLLFDLERLERYCSSILNAKRRLEFTAIDRRIVKFSFEGIFEPFHLVHLLLRRENANFSFLHYPPCRLLNVQSLHSRESIVYYLNIILLSSSSSFHTKAFKLSSNYSNND